jgi:hypothetical protein
MSFLWTELEKIPSTQFEGKLCPLITFFFSLKKKKKKKRNDKNTSHITQLSLNYILIIFFNKFYKSIIKFVNLCEHYINLILNFVYSL